MLIILRAIGILSGMATNLDHNFDPWAETIPFAERLAREEIERSWQGWLQEAVDLGQLTIKMPGQISRILADTERGNLSVQASLAPDTRKTIRRLESSVNRLTWVVIAAGMLIAGANIYSDSQNYTLGVVLIGLSFAALLWGFIKG
jgi:predicted unusual protein kinase regulating ubiquinone biosynthesis (AarF/ABC1/UbiB family)